MSLSIYLPSFSADQPRQLGGIRLHDYSYIPPRAAVIALGFFLAIGCGDPVDRDIATLIKDGDAGQEAKISLNMAKGYAVDRMADILEARGVSQYLIEIGGEFVASGVKPDRSPWWLDL